jgi:hypothetical protein
MSVNRVDMRGSPAISLQGRLFGPIVRLEGGRRDQLTPALIKQMSQIVLCLWEALRRGQRKPLQRFHKIATLGGNHPTM